MNEQQLAEIKARLDAATPRPWANMPDDCVFSGEIRGCENFEHIASMPDGDDRPADFEFIAHAPEDVADLLAEVTRLREALEFYATEENWAYPNSEVTGVLYDAGDRARVALEVTK